MKNNILTSTLILVIALNGFLYFKYKKKEQLIDLATISLSEKNAQISDQKNFINTIKQNNIKQYCANMHALNDSIIGLLRNSPSDKLVFRFAQGNCEDCVNKQLSLLKNFSTAINKHNIIVISGYSDKRQSEIFKREYGYSFNILNIKKGKFLLDESLEPFFFTYSDSKGTANFFIPPSTDTLLTKKYLKTVCNNY